MAARLWLYSDIPCAGGVRLHAITGLEAGVNPQRLDNREALSFTVSKDGAWLADALPGRHVVQVELPEHGTIFEWRLTKMVDGVDSGATVSVEAEPLILVLRDVGPMRLPQGTGGGGRYSLAGQGLTPAEYIDTFILAFLQSVGVTWITRGTVDSAVPLTIAWDRWRPIQLLHELARLTGLEARLRRNATTDYRIDLTRVGDGLAKALVAERRNLLGITRTRSPEGFATVIQPFGGVPEGAAEPATLGLAAWTVTNVASNVVTLSDRTGGPGPVLTDGQWVGNYVLTATAALREITASSAANQTVTLDSVTGVAVGDDVEIRANSDGDLLEEVSDPDAALRVVQVVEIGNLRGERNYTPNPFAEDWPDKPDGVWARVNATVSNSSTLTIKDVEPADRAFQAGDVIGWIVENRFPVRVTANATASGGVATLSVSPNTSAALNDELQIYQLTALPTGWTDVQAGTGKASVFQYRDPTATNVACQVNGAHALARRIALDGLPAGTEIYAGDMLLSADGTKRKMILLPAAESSGAATVTIEVGETFVDNDSVYIVRPRLETPSSAVVTLMTRMGSAGETGRTGAYLQLPPITVRPTPGFPRLWLRAGLTMRGQVSLSVGASLEPPKIELHDGTNVVASVQLGDLWFPLLTDPDTDVDLHLVPALGYEMSSTQTLAPRILGCTSTSAHPTETISHPVTFVRWVSMSLGSDDPAAPPVWGSHANRLVQVGNQHLALGRLIPSEWVVTSRELTERFGLTPPENQLQLGTDVRLMAPSMGVDETLRVVEVVFDLKDEANTTFVLSTRLQEATAQIARQLSLAVSGGAGGVVGGTTLTPADLTAAVVVAQPEPADSVVRVRDRIELLDPATGEVAQVLRSGLPTLIEGAGGFEHRWPFRTPHAFGVSVDSRDDDPRDVATVQLRIREAIDELKTVLRAAVSTEHTTGSIDAAITALSAGFTHNGAGNVFSGRAAQAIALLSDEAAGTVDILEALFLGCSQLSGTSATAEIVRALTIADVNIGTVENTAIKTGAGDIDLGGRMRWGGGAFIDSSDDVGDPTWDLLAETTLGSDAASISFGSIDTGYKIFRLDIYAEVDAVAMLAVRLNSDSGTNYAASRMSLATNATTWANTQGASATSVLILRDSAGADTGIYARVHIAKLATGERATILSHATTQNSAVAYTQTAAGIWINTADLISAIAVLPSTGNLRTGSHVQLFGRVAP